MNQPLIIQRVWVRFALAFTLVAIAAVLRKWPLQFLDSTLVWLTFYPAVVIVAICGGLSAGLLATALACLTVVFLWPLLVAHPFINALGDWLGMSIFIFTCTMISGISELMHRTQARVAVYRSLFDCMDEGFCVVEMIYDSNHKPIDYRFVEINPAFENQTGLYQAQGRTMRELVPNHDEHWFEIYGKVARTGESIRFANPATAMKRHYDVYAYRIGGDGSNRVGILFKDVTAQKGLQDQLREQADTDSLTGCSNRRFFLEKLEQEFARVRRYGGVMSILMLDLDHFKAINDRYGHLAGDAVLTSVVQVCTGHLREVDVIGRLGGEEFAILLPETEIERAFEIAERLYQSIAAEEVAIGGNCFLHVTTSIGIATSAVGDAEVETIIGRADAALYKAKEAGRNRVFV